MKIIPTISLISVLTFLSLTTNVHAGLTDIETTILRGSYDQVESLVADYLAQNPSPENALEARYYLGLSYLHRKQYGEAKNLFEALTKEKTDDLLRDKIHLGLLDAHYMNEQYKEALKIGENLLKLSPRSMFLSLIYLKLGRANLKLSYWRQAQQYFKKIVRNFSQSLEYDAAKQLLEEKKYFAVQVGAFMDRGRAEHLMEELKERGEYAYIVEMLDQKNRKFYRVRVGQLALLDQAKQVRSRLATQGYPTQIYP